MALRLRRGTNAERLLVTPLQGELIYATDTKKLYVGDGATIGGVLVGPTDADTFTNVVDDTTPQLGGDLDLNNHNITGTGSINITGTIHATGNITSDGDIGLGNDTSDVISVNGVINSPLRPALTGQFDLGNEVRRWRNLHVNTVFADGEVQAESIFASRIVGNDSSVFWDAATDEIIVDTVTTNNLSVSGTFTGDVAGNLEGNVTSTGTSNFATANITNAVITGGTLDGVVIGEDGVTPRQNISGRVITAFNGFVGNLEGDVQGNVTGDVRGSLSGGNIFGGDSTLLIDGDNSLIVGDVDNTQVVTKEAVIGTLTLSGTNSGGIKAGIDITTDGTLDDDYSLFNVRSINNTSTPAGFTKIRSRGTAEAPTSVQDNDAIFSEIYAGITGGPNGVVVLSTIDVSVDGTVSGDAAGGKFVISTSDATGTLTPALTVNKAQGIEVTGTSAANIQKLAVLTSAPVNPEEGMIAVADGNTTGWDPKGTDVGTSYPCYYNGTIWTALI